MFYLIIKNFSHKPLKRLVKIFIHFPTVENVGCVLKEHYIYQIIFTFICPDSR